MRVKARAVIIMDGRLVAATQRRRGGIELTLPGGRVKPRESVIDALVREVREETGLEIEPGDLVYVAEFVDAYRTHDLELIYRAEARSSVSEDKLRFVDLRRGNRPEIRPAILDDIARDAASGWQHTPRWLGNLLRK